MGAAGAAAERALLAPLHLDRLTDRRGELAGLRADIVVAGEVAGVVVGDRLLARGRGQAPVAHELGEQLGVVHAKEVRGGVCQGPDVHQDVSRR